MTDFVYVTDIFNLAVSWGLVILIWLVQIIIYPGFRQFPSQGFAAYHQWYVIRISVIVLPLMICELIFVIAWLVIKKLSFYALLSVVLVILVWLSTFLFQVPIHNHLRTGKDLAAIRRLVATNWIRTVAWSIKAVVVTIAVIGGAKANFLTPSLLS